MLKGHESLKLIIFNENAVEKEVIVEDFLATVFQHELDHLFGFLYVDRLNSTKDLVFEEELTNIASGKTFRLNYAEIFFINLFIFKYAFF